MQLVAGQPPTSQPNSLPASDQPADKPTTELANQLSSQTASKPASQSDKQTARPPTSQPTSQLTAEIRDQRTNNRQQTTDHCFAFFVMFNFDVGSWASNTKTTTTTSNIANPVNSKKKFCSMICDIHTYRTRITKCEQKSTCSPFSP